MRIQACGMRSIFSHVFTIIIYCCILKISIFSFGYQIVAINENGDSKDSILYELIVQLNEAKSWDSWCSDRSFVDAAIGISFWASQLSK